MCWVCFPFCRKEGHEDKLKQRESWQKLWCLEWVWVSWNMKSTNWVCGFVVFFLFGLTSILFFPKARLGNPSVVGIKAHYCIQDGFAPGHGKAGLLLRAWAWARDGAGGTSLLESSIPFVLVIILCLPIAPLGEHCVIPNYSSGWDTDVLSQMLMEFPAFLLLQALLVLCLCVQEGWFRSFVSDTSHVFLPGKELGQHFPMAKTSPVSLKHQDQFSKV